MRVCSSTTRGIDLGNSVYCTVSTGSEPILVSIITMCRLLDEAHVQLRPVGIIESPIRRSNQIPERLYRFGTPVLPDPVLRISRSLRDSL